MVDTEVLLNGEELSLHALVVNKRCLIRDFIDCLDVGDKKQVGNLLKQRANRAQIHNQQHFRTLGDEIFELKTRNGIRILCFWSGKGKLIITHGFFKSHPKILKQEKEKALNWLKEFREKRR
jgi:phage-related protein